MAGIFPGGGIDLGETIEEALKREVKEETGVSVKWENSFLRPTASLLQQKSVTCIAFLYYTCTDPVGEISAEGFDQHQREYAQPAEWMPLEEAKKLKFFNPVDSPTLIRLAAESKAVAQSFFWWRPALVSVTEAPVWRRLCV
jgi:8-oxo-dGTP pyrophosphatase MutT (NUDIX family)